MNDNRPNKWGRNLPPPRIDANAFRGMIIGLAVMTIAVVTILLLPWWPIIMAVKSGLGLE